MTWQDELKELDAKLAAGAVSADDYRRARDEVLRQAQSGVTKPKPSPTPAEAPAEPAPQAEAGQQPFAPPFKWDDRPAGGESTQMMRPVGDQDSGEQSDRTQVVPDSPTGETTQIVRGADSAPPGAWSVARPGDTPPGQHPESGATWPPLQQAGTPWGGQDFDPVVAPNTGWMMQGPEAFEKPPGRGRRTLGIVVAAVLVVGVIAAGVIYFITSKDDPGTAGPQTSSTRALPTPTSRELPEPPQPKGAPDDNASALIAPPGNERGGGGPFDLPALQGNGLLPKPVVEALQNAGMKDGLLKTTSRESMTIGMYVLAVKDEDGARSVAQSYGSTQEEGGLPTDDSLSMQGVPVFSTPDKAEDQVFRAVYVLYDRVVIVETFGPERDAVQQQFKELLAKQVDHAPPSVRES